jgi:hypothetical protein
LNTSFSACGVKITPSIMRDVNEYLTEQNYVKIDDAKLLKIITKIRELASMDSDIADGDEYIDAFEALGGGPGKEGTVSKDTLI